MGNSISSNDSEKELEAERQRHGETQAKVREVEGQLSQLRKDNEELKSSRTLLKESLEKRAAELQARVKELEAALATAHSATVEAEQAEREAIEVLANEQDGQSRSDMSPEMQEKVDKLTRARSAARLIREQRESEEAQKRESLDAARSAAQKLDDAAAEAQSARQAGRDQGDDDDDEEKEESEQAEPSLTGEVREKIEVVSAAAVDLAKHGAAAVRAAAVAVAGNMQQLGEKIGGGHSQGADASPAEPAAAPAEEVAAPEAEQDQVQQAEAVPEPAVEPVAEPGPASAAAAAAAGAVVSVLRVAGKLIRRIQHPNGEVEEFSIGAEEGAVLGYHESQYPADETVSVNPDVVMQPTVAEEEAAKASEQAEAVPEPAAEPAAQPNPASAAAAAAAGAVVSVLRVAGQLIRRIQHPNGEVEEFSIGAEEGAVLGYHESQYPADETVSVNPDVVMQPTVAEEEAAKASEQAEAEPGDENGNVQPAAPSQEDQDGQPPKTLRDLSDMVVGAGRELSSEMAGLFGKAKALAAGLQGEGAGEAPPPPEQGSEGASDVPPPSGNMDDEHAAPPSPPPPAEE